MNQKPTQLRLCLSGMANPPGISVVNSQDGLTYLFRRRAAKSPEMPGKRLKSLGTRSTSLTPLCWIERLRLAIWSLRVWTWNNTHKLTRTGKLTRDITGLSKASIKKKRQRSTVKSKSSYGDSRTIPHRHSSSTMMRITHGLTICTRISVRTTTWACPKENP